MAPGRPNASCSHLSLDPTAGPLAALVIDPDAQARELAVRLLQSEGIDACGVATLAQARARLEATHFDVVSAQSALPDGDGIALTAQLGREQPETATILIGGSTADVVQAGAGGPDDCLQQPFSAEQLSVSVSRALHRRLERSRLARSEAGPEEPSAVTAHNRLAEEVLDCLARAGRLRNEETAEHVERVSRSCGLIGAELGLPTQECGTLRAASAMHDIGKIGVPDALLGKLGRLSAAEKVQVEGHAEIGFEILIGSSDAVLDLAATIALTHHERSDGKGYPRGLSGDEIPLAGRITAVADAYDALTHDRVYRPALSTSGALELLDEGDGTRFDSDVLAAFRAVLPQIEQIGAVYRDSVGPPAVLTEPTAAERPLRVLLVDDHAAMASGLALLLRGEGMEIAGLAGTLGEAERMIARRAADVVVLDRELQGRNCLCLVAAARARGARVLLYTDQGTQPHDPEEESPDGVASKTGGLTDLLAAIRDVAAGGTPSDNRVRSAASPSALMLTPREREITALLALGHNGEDIATQLFLSHHTIRTHVRNAMTTVHARTRSHLVALALDAGEIAVDHEQLVESI